MDLFDDLCNYFACFDNDTDNNNLFSNDKKNNKSDLSDTEDDEDNSNSDY